MTQMALIMCIMLPIFASTDTNTDITLFALSNLEAISGKSIVGAQWLAIQEINNNSNLLPNYTLKLKVYDSHDPQQALVHSLDIINSINDKNNTNTYFPILLGAPWSSLSTLTASVLNAFNMGQMSAGSTSIALSDTDRYPYFYRTIPSDALQAEGLIILCNAFNWSKVAVVYINDAYGLHLSLGIQELSKEYNIEVTSIAVAYEDVTTYNYASKQIKDLNIFIIIVIIHNDDSILLLFNEFKSQGIASYPYFILGVDAWFDTSTITKWNLTQKTNGFIGTVPWQTHSLPLNEYKEENVRNVVEMAMIKSAKLSETWKHFYDNGFAEYLYTEIPGTTFIYGYDAIYSIVYAMQQVIDNNNMNLIDLINKNNNELIDILTEYITNDINFIGASGRVVFDNIGERKDGLYSFGNILNDGTVEYFGYFYQDIDGTIGSFIDIDRIIFPDYFTEKGLIPHSEIIIHVKILMINKLLSISMFILSSIIIIIIFMAIIFVIIYRNNQIIKHGSYRLNIIMSIGCILSFISVILFGIDENYINSNYTNSIVCELRLWIIYVSFTVMAMPLFLKTWRLARIFSALFRKHKVNDKLLFILLLLCIVMDIILLTIFMIIEPYQRIYENGKLETIDKLQQIQYKYGICSFNSKHSNLMFYFYIILGLWKFTQLMFGFYVAMSVARIHNQNKIINQNVLSTFAKLDETGAQLLSILITFIILCIAVLITTFIPNDLPSIHYCIIAITTLLIGIIVFLLNLSPRIIAVITKNNRNYKKSIEQKFKEKLKKQIQKMDFDESWLTQKTCTTIPGIPSTTIPNDKDIIPPTPPNITPNESIIVYRNDYANVDNVQLSGIK